ncbi:helix-turn-helix domain-containing protein [Nocardia sp. NPDC004068]|uniref:MmyB family transcriptional regulator n=1 Tax=Nocardia sp. NPDC004068 TaxID=3364303 RepID=UPI00369E4F3C
MGPSGRSSAPAEMPSLGASLWYARTRLNLSRESAAREAEISSSAVNAIEHGHRIPSREVVNKLAHVYRLNHSQQRHIHDLREPSAPLPHPDDLRQLVSHPGIQAHLDHLSIRATLAAYADPLSTVLRSNQLFQRILPGLPEADSNLAVWFFTPQGRHTIDHWHYEAHRAVTVLRMLLGRYRDTPQARALLRKLRKFPDFNQLWADTGLQVAYGHVGPTEIRINIPGAKRPVTLSPDISEFSDRSDVFFVSATFDDPPPSGQSVRA